MATRNPSRKKSVAIRIVIVVIVALLASLAVLGGSLAVSANRALGLVEQARASYDEARASLDDGNFEKAYASARSAVDSISALPKELDGPQWSIAAALPVIGTDAQMAREMSSIAGKLADEAATPVFDQWDSITRALTEGEILRDKERAAAFFTEDLPRFAETLARAEQVVYECEGRANNLPEAHIAELNNAASELKNAMTTVGDMLRSFDQLVSAIDPASLLGNALDGIGLASLFNGVGFP